MDAQAQLKRAEEQMTKQEAKLEEARKRAADLESYATQIEVRRAQGEELESTVTPEQIIRASQDLKTATAVFAELHKIHQQAAQEIEGAERALFTDEWNRKADERAKINSRIESATLALKMELEALKQLDREQRPCGARLGVSMNPRLYSAQQNFIAFNLREFVEPAGVLAAGLRRPISEMDRMTRHAAPQAKEVTT